MSGGNVGAVCACGASYEAFRAVDDCGHALTFASVHAMLGVASDDPELWLAKSKGAVLRLWGQLKRDQWEVTHGYCRAALAEDPDDARAETGDTSFDPDNLCAEHVEHSIEADALPRCDCDHCTIARLTNNPLPVHTWQRRLRCASDQIRGVAWVSPPPAGQPAPTGDRTMNLDDALNAMLQDARDLVRGYYGPNLDEADLDWDAPAQFHGDYWLETDARVSHALGFISGVAAGLDMTPLELLDYVPEHVPQSPPIVPARTPARNVVSLTKPAKRVRKEQRR